MIWDSHRPPCPPPRHVPLVPTRRDPWLVRNEWVIVESGTGRLMPSGSVLVPGRSYQPICVSPGQLRALEAEARA